jgi:putative ABC transport system substrate-binding protein
MSYGPVHVDLLERTAKLTAQILDGAKPSDLPVEQPSRFELIVNASAAKAIGLDIPPSIVFRANEVLE